MDRPPRRRGAERHRPADAAAGLGAAGHRLGGAARWACSCSSCGAPAGPRRARPAPGTPLHHAYLQATTVTFAGDRRLPDRHRVRRPHRAQPRCARSGCASNPLLLAGIAFELVFAAALIYLPPLQAVFGTAALPRVGAGPAAADAAGRLGHRRALPGVAPRAVHRGPFPAARPVRAERPLTSWSNLMTITSGAATVTPAAPTDTELAALDAWWRAANYLAVGQIYLHGQPAAARAAAPRARQAPAARALGHHTRADVPVGAPQPRDPRRDEPDALFVTGPGHGGPGRGGHGVAGGHLHRALPRRHPGRRRACGSCSASSPSPAGSPATPRRRHPGSIHEGGELGYSLAHAYGAALDNPDLLVACVIGDGEAETGPLADVLAREQVPRPGAPTAPCCRSCTSTATRSPTRRCWPGSRSEELLGAAARATATAATWSRAGRRTRTRWPSHRRMAATLDEIVAEIARIRAARPSRVAAGEAVERPRWPVLVLRSPKGWTGPATVDGQPVEGTWRAHQVPLAAGPRRTQAAPRAAGASGCAPTGPRSCSTPTAGRAAGARRRCCPARRPPDERHARTPTAVSCCAPLRLPDFRDHAVAVPDARWRGPRQRHRRARRVAARGRRGPTPTTSGSSAPTRSPPTGCRPSST